MAYVVTLAVSYSADHFNAYVSLTEPFESILIICDRRGLHSAVMATIGAAGFIGSAALAPDAYSVSYAPYTTRSFMS